MPNRLLIDDAGNECVSASTSLAIVIENDIQVACGTVFRVWDEWIRLEPEWHGRLCGMGSEDNTVHLRVLRVL